MNIISLISLFVVWYIFGWMGSILLFAAVTFCVSYVYKTLQLNVDTKVTTRLHKFIVRAYKYFDLDCVERAHPIRVQVPVICIMAAGAMFGTYMYMFAFVLSLLLTVNTIIYINIYNIKK